MSRDSDIAQTFRAIKEERAELRAAHGVDCPGCRKVQPKRIPSILLPQQQCRVCGYRDPRPRIPRTT